MEYNKQNALEVWSTQYELQTHAIKRDKTLYW